MAQESPPLIARAAAAATHRLIPLGILIAFPVAHTGRPGLPVENVRVDPPIRVVKRRFFRLRNLCASAGSELASSTVQGGYGDCAERILCEGYSWWGSVGEVAGPHASLTSKPSPRSPFAGPGTPLLTHIGTRSCLPVHRHRLLNGYTMGAMLTWANVGNIIQCLVFSAVAVLQ